MLLGEGTALAGGGPPATGIRTPVLKAQPAAPDHRLQGGCRFVSLSLQLEKSRSGESSRARCRDGVTALHVSVSTRSRACAEPHPWRPLSGRARNRAGRCARKRVRTASHIARLALHTVCKLALHTTSQDTRAAAYSLRDSPQANADPVERAVGCLRRRSTQRHAIASTAHHREDGRRECAESAVLTEMGVVAVVARRWRDGEAARGCRVGRTTQVTATVTPQVTASQPRPSSQR